MITNPVGIDAPIQDMQQLFIDELWTSISDDKKQYHHRVFNNPKDGKNRPEVLKDGTVKYDEVKFNNRLSVLSWFDVSDSTDSYNLGQINQDVGVFFAVNLNDVYPSLSHRSVEEVHLDAQKILLKRSGEFEITGITTGAEAYGNFSTENLKAFNMQPWHVFRFDCNVKYSLNC